MKKILIVFGTRPEAIKMAPLIKAFQDYPEHFETRICVTAQHREMLDQVLHLFGIIPDFDLNIMRPGQDLYDITANVLQGMKEVLRDYQPDIVFVHGDTTTTFAASLAAFYQHIKIAHIEAGLRTDNIYSPWPEEANRQLASRLSSYHFAPTNASKQNLLRENIAENTISITGNTVIDALFLALKKIEHDPELKKSIITTLKSSIHHSTFNLHHSMFILVTGHRRENHGEGFIRICNALKQLALKNPNVHIVYPVHLNPNVQKPVKALLSNTQNIHLIEPLQYETFIYLMNRAYFIITDSGGVQEEAPSLGKPVLVMRDTTERPEALEAGTVKLVGTDTDAIIYHSQQLLDSHEEYTRMSKAHNPYGDGHACERIVHFISQENI